MPAEAKGTSQKSAKAFVRYYFDSINFAAGAGDTTHLRSLGVDKCESCQAIASNIEKIYRAGGTIETEGWKLRTISAVPLQPKTKPVFDLSVLVSPETVVSRSGASEKQYDGGRQAMTMYLVRAGSGWRITRLDRVS